jgi:hypothetical protein
MTRSGAVATTQLVTQVTIVSLSADAQDPVHGGSARCHPTEQRALLHPIVLHNTLQLTPNALVDSIGTPFGLHPCSGLLGKQKEFLDVYAKPIEVGRDEQALAQASNINQHLYTL